MGGRALYGSIRTKVLPARWQRTLSCVGGSGRAADAILVVEDEALIALMLTDGLESAGHEVMGPAATLGEALALCEAGPPELALRDFDLRDGGSGVVLTRALFERWRVPVIFANGEFAEARRARDVALGQIRKPYEAGTVLRSVELAREVLGGSQPRRVPAGLELFSAAE
jgi:two-component system, response regulator PdtaR